MDIYRALIGEPPTEEEKLAALAAQLRMRNNQGMLGQLSGDKVLAPVGKGLSSAADEQAQQLGVRGESARYRKYQENASAGNLAQSAAEQKWREKNAVDERAHELALERLRTEGDLKVAGARAAPTSMSEKDKAKYARQLSHDLDKANAPFLNSSYKALDDALRPFVDPVTGGKKAGVKDIPGLGAGSILPHALTSKEGRPVRQAVTNLRNQFLKMASGAAVTNPEAARMYEAIGTALGGTDEDVLYGLGLLRSMKDSSEENIYAGYDPEVIEMYQGRRGQHGGRGAGLAGADTGVSRDPADYASYEEYLQAVGGR